MKKSFVCFSLAFALFFGSASFVLAADILVIANKGVSASSLSKDELKRIYLGKLSRWENGDKVNFCLVKTDLLETFCQEYVGQSSMNYLKHWKKLVFTGKGSMPPFYDKDEDVIQFVAETKGAVGFVSSGANTDSVKVMSID
ncbi:MAG: phosphate ABC transporter substrate-binding protein [Desulfobacteraceae bacterium]|nr:phosphate ABC transporter substrate-binding protein [Desulfobacteraceae bacterium]